MLYKLIKNVFIKACNRSFVGAVIDRGHYFVERRIFGFFWKCEMALRGVRSLLSFKSMDVIGRPIVSMAIGSTIQVGKDIVFMSSSRFCLSASLFASCKLKTIYPSARIVIGDGASFNGVSIVCRSSSIYIGARTMIGPNATIIDSPFHSLWPLNLRNSYSSQDLDESVEIGEDVWIGAHVIILPGSKIGSGSVIGAGSIVRGTVPPNCLAAGSPVHIIRELDKECGA
jgi:acetyltransferase-like isoleucine patch superfamily enzyme